MYPRLPYKAWNSSWGDPPESYWRAHRQYRLGKYAANAAKLRNEKVRANNRARADVRAVYRANINPFSRTSRAAGKRPMPPPTPSTPRGKRKRTDSAYGTPSKRHGDQTEYNLRHYEKLRDDPTVSNYNRAANAASGVGGVIGAVGTVASIANSNTPWATAGGEAGAFLGGIVGSELGPIGSMVASEVGSIIGSAVGSAGDTATSWLFGSESGSTQQNNMPKAGFAPFNSSKSSAVKKGHVKVASSNKKVKVSKSLREKVKKVINGSRPQGVYKFCSHGFIYLELTDSTANTFNAQNVVNTANYTFPVTLPIPALLNSKQWFAGFAQTSTNAARNISFPSSGVFEYFTPTKILNATSILFANKVMPNEFDILNSQQIATTVQTPGAAPAGSVPKQLVHVNNAYVTLAFKNCAARVLIVDFYICTLKRKTQTPEGMNHIYDALLLDQRTDTATTDFIPTFKTRDTSDSNEKVNYGLTNMMFEPAMLKNFNAVFKYEKLTMTIQPGETITKTIQGPRNYTMDYSKVVGDNGNPNATLHYKPTTVVCFASLRPDMQFLTGGMADVATTSGVASAIKGVLNRPACPIAIVHEEVYDLAMPLNTGFVYTTVNSAGTTQNLTNVFEKKRIYLNDRRAAAGQNTTAYVTVNEENPAVNNVITANSVLY
nr:MAG: capsid protein [Chemarfal virus 174]